MKQRFIAIALAIIFIIPCFVLSSCEKDDIETLVRFTVYDNGEGDMISFYMTSDVKPFGVWDYSIDNNEVFDTFLYNENTNDYGLFGLGGTASYNTLILTPVTEGASKISFYLSKGDMKYDFSLKVTKDSETNKFKIEAKKI